MAGYSGYSKSNNAVEAEAGGRHPMTAAKRLVVGETGLSQAEAGNILRELYRGEYHHTSKKYNATNYYNTAAAIRLINFARSLGVKPCHAFLSAAIAWGIDGEDEFEQMVADETNALGGVEQTKDERIAEFVEAVKTGRWI